MATTQHAHGGGAGSNFTTTDLNNANKFAEANLRIRTILACDRKAKHLTRWLQYEIRDATMDDYYVPEALQSKCKVVSISMTRTLCEMLTCNAVRERDTCPADSTVASYYYVGDSGYDAQCQPACFHSASAATYSDDGLRVPDMPRLHWYRNKCRLVNAPIVNYLEKPFYRSDTRYEFRVNDMPTGFSRVYYFDDLADGKRDASGGITLPPNNTSGDLFGCGFTYKNNPTYCQYFDRQFNAQEGTCEMSTFEKIIDSTIGMSIINMIRSGVRMVTNDGVPFKLPTNLPTLPDKPIRPEHALDSWLQNVNPDFKLPTPIDTQPQSAEALAGAAMAPPPPLPAPPLPAPPPPPSPSPPPPQQQRDADSKQRGARRRRSLDAPADDSANADFDLNAYRRQVERHRLLHKVSSLRAQRKRRSQADAEDASSPRAEPAEDNETPEDIETPSFLKDPYLISVYKSVKFAAAVLFRPEVLQQLALDQALATVFKVSAKFTLQFLERLLAQLATISLRGFAQLGSGVFSAALTSITVSSVGRYGVQFVSQSALFLTKMIASAASVVGVLLIVLSIFSLIFELWDPFNYNKMFPSDAAENLMLSGERALREAMASAEATFEFDNFAARILSKDELLQLQLESFSDRLIYLDALEVNSEGTLIDKGEPINFTGVTVEQVRSAQQAGMAHVYKWNARTFDEYNERFYARDDFQRRLNGLALTCVVAGCVAMFTRAPLLGALLLIVALVVLAVARVAIQDDVLLDTYRRWAAAWL